MKHCIHESQLFLEYFDFGFSLLTNWSFAGIVKVFDKRTGQIVIEKRMKAEDIKKGLSRREVDTLLQLRHCPYITKILDCYINPRQLEGSIFLEYCRLGTLADLVVKHRNARTPIGEHYIWTWGTQLAEALSYCFNGPHPNDPRVRAKWNYTIHRDLKLDNVLLTRANEGPDRGQIVAKLADMGCAVRKSQYVYGKVNPKHASLYTKDWRPPEFPAYSQKSDVWQLGAILRCLCDLTFAFGRKPEYRLCTYSTPLNTIVSQCLERDPGKRLSSEILLYTIKTTYAAVHRHLPKAPQLLLPEETDRPQGNPNRPFMSGR